MAKRTSRQDLLDVLSNFLVHNKGLPVLVGVGLIIVSLILNAIPSLASAPGFWGWLVRANFFLHLGAAVGLVGILVGDAL